ncbi:MAG: hypothetical protein Q8P86_00475 [bacterium]|nr:hypothetical protein [bacterium]
MTTRLIVFRSPGSDKLFAHITRGETPDMSTAPVCDAVVVYVAFVPTDASDETSVRRLAESDLKRPHTTRIEWFESGVIWKF